MKTLKCMNCGHVERRHEGKKGKCSEKHCRCIEFIELVPGGKFELEGGPDEDLFSYEEEG